VKGQNGARQPLAQRRPKTARAKAPKLAPKTAPKGRTKPAVAVPPGSAKPAPNAKAPKRKKPRIADLPAHSSELYRRLESEYPDAHCELDYSNPFQLLVATILSAQCTDKRVNMVTPVLWERYKSVEALAAAPQEEIEEIIKSTGFFRNKAKSVLGMANALVARHNSEVPSSMEELVTLPGVGRKTANVILGNAFGKNEGVVVDTHVARLSARLGLTTETDPVRIEQQLIKLFAQDRWTMLSHLLIFHGRRVCDAKAPKCGACVLRDICPSSTVPTLSPSP
jgi:endonuclease III